MSGKWQQPLMEEAPPFKFFKKAFCVHVTLRILVHHAFNYNWSAANLYSITSWVLGTMKPIEQWV